MKKLFALLIAVMLLSVSVAVSAETAQPDLLARIKERGALIIATEGNWSPWTYHDENDVLTGFDIEIGTLIAHGLGVEPQFMETDWASILAGVDTGRFDIACNGVDYTEGRAEKYSFSDPYVYTEIVLAVKEGNETINADSFSQLCFATMLNSRAFVSPS